MSPAAPGAAPGGHRSAPGAGLRSVALDGFSRAFPDRPLAERRRLARSAYRQLGRSLCELFLVRGASGLAANSQVTQTASLGVMTVLEKPMSHHELLRFISVSVG